MRDSELLNWLIAGHLEIKNRWLIYKPTRRDIADLIRQEREERKLETNK